MPIVPSSTGQQIFFPQINVLDGKLITGIETFIPEINPKTPGNVALANSDLISVSYLNLVVGDVQQIWNLPLLKVLNVNNQFTTGVGSSLFNVEFNNLKIIWAKSYIFIADVSKIAATAESFMFNISYSDHK